MTVKKSLLFAIIASASLVSCKKNYTCECEVNMSTTAMYYYGELASPAYAQLSSYTKNINDRKRQAEKTCESENATSTTNAYQIPEISGGVTTTKINCDLD